MTEQELKAQLAVLEKNADRIAAAVEGLDESVLRYKLAPNKWSILEILAHLSDVEIIWGYRIRQAIADKKPTFAPIDQDDWARHLGYTESSAADSLALYKANRCANLRVLRRLTVGDLAKGGFHPELNR